MPTRFNPISSPEFPSFSFGKSVGGNTSTTTSSSGTGGNPISSPPFSSFSFKSPPPSNNNPLNTTTTPLQQQQNSNNLETPISSSYSRRNSNNNNNVLPKSSLALSCQSPDALSIHTLINNNTCIQTQTLPIDSNNSTTSTNITIRTELPSWLISIFKIDPPIELLCLDNDTSITSTLKSSLSNHDTNDGGNGIKVNLPLLCLYTNKGVYILQITLSTKSSKTLNDKVIFMGKVESIHEPLETYLQDNLFIQRIRPAPYTHIAGGMLHNLSPFIPKGCMAILLSSSSSHQSPQQQEDYYYQPVEEENEYSYSQLILFHGIDHYIKNKDKSNIMKYLTISEMNTIDPLVDFTFLSSSNSSTSINDSSTTNTSCTTSSIWNNTSSFWNGLSIVLSTNESELYTMTPIVFHGMAIPRHYITNSIQWIKYMNRKDSSSEKENDQIVSNMSTLTIVNKEDDENDIVDNGALQRRNTAALVYIKDVFGIEV